MLRQLMHVAFDDGRGKEMTGLTTFVNVYVKSQNEKSCLVMVLNESEGWWE